MAKKVDHSLSTYPLWMNAYPDGINWHQTFKPALLYEMLHETAARFPSNPCMDFMGKITSYEEIDDLVHKAARGLQKIGVRKGTRVGLFLPNTPYYVICYFAILKAGGTVVNFNPLYAPHELLHQIDDSGTEMMVTLDVEQVYEKVEAILHNSDLKKIIVCPMADALPFPKNFLFPLLRGREIADIPNDKKHISFDSLLDNDGRPAPMRLDPEKDIALLQYTGGTTGVPKGAMLTHANLSINAQQCAAWYDVGIDGSERTLGVIPFFHVFAMTAVMNLSVLKGYCIIASPRFDLDETLRLIERKRPTLFPAVPTIYTAINHHKDVDSYDLTSIRFCISGGAPLPRDVRDAFVERTGCTLVEGYGLTETSPVTHCNPTRGANKSGSIGLPLPGTTSTIVDVEDPTKIMPIGEKGLIAIEGPQVMKGYYNNKEATDAIFVDGRLITGDIGTMDSDGYTFIVDRLKDVILCGGYNIYPRHVEEAVYQHPDVEEVICGGIPDEYRGETVKIWVKLKDGKTLTKEALTVFLKDYLSPIEMPKHIEFRDQPLPKTMIGKLSRKDILSEEKSKS